MRDSNGRDYLDGFAGIATLTLGHNHPEVTRAVADQAGKLVHTSTLYDNEPLLDLVELLADIAPRTMSKVFVGNSGSEANEMAALVAKTARNSQEILALDHAYHGRTLYTVAMSGMSNWRNFGVQAANVAFVPNAYCYRCPLDLTYPSCEIACARSAKRVIETQTSGSPAALIAETIEGVGGIITPPPEYYKVLQETLAPFGTLLIADEVQTAWGRLGDGIFGMPSTYGIVPDIITSAKGLANGLPISVTITRPELADAFKGPHINTFGGNPLSARAAGVTLEVLQRDHLIANAKRQGETLLSSLRAMQKQYPLIGEVRGRGLMIGVELVKDSATKEPATSQTADFVELMRERGILVGRGGRWSSVIRIQPPLIFDEADSVELLSAFESSLAALA
ncbi:MAG: aspartate aminotransferase family protein [Candidatus Eremiobacteraeota bacterium]|nr:aspartate aminotransferase family protein [Candidatus Eremiobacteraeota bacterium]